MYFITSSGSFSSYEDDDIIVTDIPMVPYESLAGVALASPFDWSLLAAANWGIRCG